MISCLILSGKNIQSITRKKLLQSLLQHKDYEIDKHNSFKSIVFIWNDTCRNIWQIVYDLEYSCIHVGYGFGYNKQTAKKAAKLILEKREKMALKE